MLTLFELKIDNNLPAGDGVLSNFSEDEGGVESAVGKIIVLLDTGKGAHVFCEQVEARLLSSQYQNVHSVFLVVVTVVLTPTDLLQVVLSCKGSTSSL